MLLLTVRYDNRDRVAIDGGDGVIALADAGVAESMQALIADGAEAIGRLKESLGSAQRVSLQNVEILAPLPVPRRDVMCVGKNYYEHAAEFHRSGFDSGSPQAVPEAPVIFTKATTSVIAPGAAIQGHIDPTATVDYEGELAVIIGKSGFRIAEADAFDYIFGYTIINDVTSRALQKRHSQWFIGKSLDSFGPMGPCVVTRDEIPDLDSLTLTTTVNGELRQKASLRDLIFNVPTIIAALSTAMTLLPGDIIATGTPSGVGIGFDPPRYLKAGDTVRIEISGIGVLENGVA